jgi:hypothetical protein
MEAKNELSKVQLNSQGDELFMSFHEGEYLIEAVENNGFHILSEKRQENLDADGNTSPPDLILVAKPNKSDQAWKILFSKTSVSS